MKKIISLLCVLSIVFSVCFADTSTLQRQINALNRATARNERILRNVDTISNIIGISLVAGLAVYGFKQNSIYGNICGTLFSIRLLRIIF